LFQRPTKPAERRRDATVAGVRARTIAHLAVVLALGLSSSGASAQRAIIYKCTQPDGRTEYSNVPCGPQERPDYITGDSFSVIIRDRAGPQPAVRPPLSPHALRRQRFMQHEAGEGPAPR
jgi:hypothetical protein